MALTATFETGSNGATISTSDTGSADAWTLVSGSPTYSNTHAAHGTLAAKFTANGQDLQWAITTLGTTYGRVYVYPTGFPSSASRLLEDQQGSTTGFLLAVGTTGTVVLFDSTFTSVATTATLQLNQWNRIEWEVVHSTTAGAVTVKLFTSADSSSATETKSSPTNWNTLASVNNFQIGSYGGSSYTGDFWLDDIVANATSYPGSSAPSVEKQTTYFTRARYVSGRR